MADVDGQSEQTANVSSPKPSHSDSGMMKSKHHAGQPQKLSGGQQSSQRATKPNRSISGRAASGTHPRLPSNTKPATFQTESPHLPNISAPPDAFRASSARSGSSPKAPVKPPLPRFISPSARRSPSSTPGSTSNATQKTPESAASERSVTRKPPLPKFNTSASQPSSRAHSRTSYDGLPKSPSVAPDPREGGWGAQGNRIGSGQSGQAPALAKREGKTSSPGEEERRRKAELLREKRQREAAKAREEAERRQADELRRREEEQVRLETRRAAIRERIQKQHEVAAKMAQEKAKADEAARQAIGRFLGVKPLHEKWQEEYDKQQAQKEAEKKQMYDEAARKRSVRPHQIISGEVQLKPPGEHRTSSPGRDHAAPARSTSPSPAGPKPARVRSASPSPTSPKTAPAHARSTSPGPAFLTRERSSPGHRNISPGPASARSGVHARVPVPPHGPAPTGAASPVRSPRSDRLAHSPHHRGVKSRSPRHTNDGGSGTTNTTVFASQTAVAAVAVAAGASSSRMGADRSEKSATAATRSKLRVRSTTDANGKKNNSNDIVNSNAGNAKGTRHQRSSSTQVQLVERASSPFVFDETGAPIDTPSAPQHNGETAAASRDEMEGHEVLSSLSTVGMGTANAAVAAGAEAAFIKSSKEPVEEGHRESLPPAPEEEPLLVQQHRLQQQQEEQQKRLQQDQEEQRLLAQERSVPEVGMYQAEAEVEVSVQQPYFAGGGGEDNVITEEDDTPQMESPVAGGDEGKGPGFEEAAVQQQQQEEEEEEEEESAAPVKAAEAEQQQEQQQQQQEDLIQLESEDAVEDVAEHAAEAVRLLEGAARLLGDQQQQQQDGEEREETDQKQQEPEEEEKKAEEEEQQPQQQQQEAPEEEEQDVLPKQDTSEGALQDVAAAGGITEDSPALPSLGSHPVRLLDADMDEEEEGEEGRQASKRGTREGDGGEAGQETAASEGV